MRRRLWLVRLPAGHARCAAAVETSCAKLQRQDRSRAQPRSAYACRAPLEAAQSGGATDRRLHPGPNENPRSRAPGASWTWVLRIVVLYVVLFALVLEVTRR